MEASLWTILIKAVSVSVNKVNNRIKARPDSAGLFAKFRSGCWITRYPYPGKRRKDSRPVITARFFGLGQGGYRKTNKKL